MFEAFMVKYREDRGLTPMQLYWILGRYVVSGNTRTVQVKKLMLRRDLIGTCCVSFYLRSFF